MAATPEIRVTKAGTLVALSASTLEMRITQNVGLVAINFPSPEIRGTQLVNSVLGIPSVPIRVTKASVLVAIKVGAETKKLRAWTFTSDGHDFYVLSLGQLATDIYDQTTQQWSTWRSADSNVWRAGVGLNWDNEIVAGDLLDGTIWNVDPTTGLDEAPEGGDIPIVSYVTGFLGWRGRDPLPCFGVNLVGTQGSPEDGSAYVNLHISDDMGATFFGAGVIATPVVGKYDYDLSWYSLGQISTPGRIFRIEDGGSLERIDSLEFLQDQEAQGGGS